MKKIFEKIYEEVKKIPRGSVKTYGEIALAVGCNPRVVGYAVHGNRDPIRVPCHRVVFKDGSMAPGYVFGGPGKQKEKLISEGMKFEGDRVDSCQRSRTGKDVISEIRYEGKK